MTGRSGKTIPGFGMGSSIQKGCRIWVLFLCQTFPGHGDVSVIRITTSRFTKVGLNWIRLNLPFRQLFSAGVGSVMVRAFVDPRHWYHFKQATSISYNNVTKYSVWTKLWRTDFHWSRRERGNKYSRMEKLRYNRSLRVMNVVPARDIPVLLTKSAKQSGRSTQLDQDRYHVKECLKQNISHGWARLNRLISITWRKIWMRA